MRQELVDTTLAYYDCQCIRFGDFLLRSGRRSPIYINFRTLRSAPAIRIQTARLLLQLTADLEFDLLADIPQGVTPIVTSMSDISGIPFVSARELKDHGADDEIDGLYEAGQRVLVVDDVATSGGSFLETTEILTRHGLIVVGLLVILNRREGAQERLAKENYQLRALFDFPLEILEVGFEHGRFPSQEVYETSRRPFET